jgi:hypothetical protein
VTLGNDVTLGNGVTLGDGVKFQTSPLAVQGSKHLAVNTGPGVIQIGCITRTFNEWLDTYEEVGKKQQYSLLQVLEYKRIIDFIIATCTKGKGLKSTLKRSIRPSVKRQSSWE